MNERDLKSFDDWAKVNIINYCDAQFDGKYYVMRENSRLTKEKKNFLILSLNMGLRAWQASASREGYKLVPLNPTRNMEIAGMNAGAGFVSRSIYKAMIGAFNEST